MYKEKATKTFHAWCPFLLHSQQW